MALSSLKSRPAAAALAWSPLGPYLAAGSAAGAIDVTFSSASSLEVGREREEGEEEDKSEKAIVFFSLGNKKERKNECDNAFFLLSLLLVSPPVFS